MRVQIDGPGGTVRLMQDDPKIMGIEVRLDGTFGNVVFDMASVDQIHDLIHQMALAAEAFDKLTHYESSKG